MDPATAIVIGTLEPSPLVWRWVRRAISAGAEIRRPRRGSRVPRYAAGGPIDLDGFEPVDELAAPVTGDDVLVMLASRTGRRHGDGLVAGLSGDEFVVLLPADGGPRAGQFPARPAEEDSAEAGRAWVALVGLAGRLRNPTALEPLGRGATPRRDATVIRRPARSVPRTGCAPVPSARPDRGLSARATFARTGPPALVLVGGRDVRGRESVR